MSGQPDRCGCGRMPGVRTRQVPEGVLTWVQCPGCWAVVEPLLDDARCDDSAIERWNSRKGRRI